MLNSKTTTHYCYNKTRRPCCRRESPRAMLDHRVGTVGGVV